MPHIPLDAIRRPRDTPIWKLEAALKCRSCKKGRYVRPVHMIELTQEREIAAYAWVPRTRQRLPTLGGRCESSSIDSGQGLR
jgi:hypothetical protein